MKIGIILSQKDPETVWNAFRFANFSLTKKHGVRIFLIGKGVEFDQIKNMQFNVMEQLNMFLKQGGKIFACGTCMKSRHKKGTTICPISTLQDLMKIVEESDKVLSF